MAKKIEKTNAARLLDRAKIAYDLVPYTVDEDNLAATHVAEELGEDIATVFKTLVLRGDRAGLFVWIYKSVEKEHLQSPDFWLSCSMLAIMHWRENNQSAAQRALEQAMKLDDRQTALFFMSFNLLFERKDAALKWFDYYQRTAKTGNDAGFILLLLHTTNLGDSNSDAFAKRIKEYLFNEYNSSKSMNDLNAMIDLVKEHLVHCNTTDTYVFDMLRNHLKDYGTMSNVLSSAKDNAAIMQFVNETNCHSRDKGYIYIERFISEILDTPDKKERAYTDEIAYNEMIIKCVGNLAEAEEEFQKQHYHDTAPLNLMSECVAWLFGGHSSDFSEVARYNMFVLCKDLIEKAAERYFNEYRSKHKMVHPATIKDYNTDMNFNNKSAEIRKVEDFYSKKRMAQLATVKNTSVILSIIFAALSFIGGIVSLACNNKVDGNILLVVMGILFVLAAGLAINAVCCFFGNKKKCKNIMESTQKSLDNAKRVIEALFDEYSRYLAAYDENDRVAKDIIFAINR